MNCNSFWVITRREVVWNRRFGTTYKVLSVVCHMMAFIRHEGSQKLVENNPKSWVMFVAECEVIAAALCYWSCCGFSSLVRAGWYLEHYTVNYAHTLSTIIIVFSNVSCSWYCDYAVCWITEISNPDREHSHFKNVQTGPVIHPATYSTVPGFFPWGFSGRGTKLTAPRLRMGGVIPFLLLCACMARTKTPLPLHSTSCLSCPQQLLWATGI
jgi:hypothetical protein